MAAGTVYRGKSGMWAFVLHRITGVFVLGFLFLHIVDTSFAGLGRHAYDTIEEVYHNIFFRLGEIALIGALLFHAWNGLRIVLVDFWKKGVRYQKQLLAATAALFLATFLPTATWMMVRFFTVKG